MDQADVTRRRDAGAPAVTAALPGRYGVFLTVDCALFAGMPAVDPPLRRRPGCFLETLTQPRNLPNTLPCPRLSRHATVATQSSPPASPLLAGLWFTVFFSRRPTEVFGPILRDYSSAADITTVDHYPRRGTTVPIATTKRRSTPRNLSGGRTGGGEAPEEGKPATRRWRPPHPAYRQP